MKTHTILNGDVNLKVYQHSHQGVPLIFLHYLNGTAAIWNRLLAYFTNNYCVYTLDLRGHGHSSQPESGYEIKDFVEDLNCTLDYLKIEKAHFIGSSFGCHVATAFAAMYPKRVLSLVNSEGALINHGGPDGLFEESKEEHIQKFDKEAAHTFESREAFMTFMQENWLPWNEAREQALKDYPLRKTEDGQFGFASQKSTVISIISALYDLDIREWYHTIECPVLFLPAEMEGDLDKKMAFIGQLETILKQSRTVVIPETTHTMIFDQEERFVQEVLNFHKSYLLN